MKIKTFASNMTEIEKSDGTLVLISYSTPVAAITRRESDGLLQPFVTSTKWSRTTSKHITKWLNHHFRGGIGPREMGQEFFDKLI